MNVNEFDVLSMQFRCDNPLEVDILQEHLIQTTAQDNVYNTSIVLIEEASNLADTVYTMCSNYQKVIEIVGDQKGTVYLYITHRTEEARELKLPNHLLQYLAERKICLGVD